MAELLRVTKRGLYCEDGDFYVDPWRSVDRAVITHAHSDHARPGMKRYLCSRESELVLRLRVGAKANIDGIEYGEVVVINGVKLSLHPAGHILGSSQVRVEKDGEVWVVSGDYKTTPDRTCTPFEPIRCHTFITESTFGLPIYQWPSDLVLFEQINAWWRANQKAGRATILLGYSLGKSQRALSGLDSSIGPIFLHDSLQAHTDAYRSGGVLLPETSQVSDAGFGYDWSKAMILAPPNAPGTPWASQFGDQSSAFMSGWMAIRSARTRGSVDRGFVLSDHVDWPSLLEAVAATGAETVYATHGYSKVVARYLTEKGLDGRELPTHGTDDPVELKGPVEEDL